MPEKTGSLPDPFALEAGAESSPVDSWKIAGYPPEIHVRTLGFEGTPRQGLAATARTPGASNKDHAA